MRIVAGQWRGRRIVAPKGTTTRPTSDQVRESVFSMIESRLQDGFTGASVLDLFAGTGAMGLEAVSRGASRLVAVERDAAALGALNTNIDTVKARDRASVIRADSFSARLPRRLPNGPFTLLFVDPPYRITTSDTSKALAGLIAADAIADGALVTWEHPSNTEPDWPLGLEEIAAKRYGSTSVSLARFNKEVTGR